MGGKPSTDANQQMENCSSKYKTVSCGCWWKERKFSQLHTVEIMDIENIEWSTVTSLPHPYSEASAAICGEHIYVLGDFDDTGKTKSVLTCSLTDLLCCKKSTVWSRVADVPTTGSTCAVISGHLLTISGLDAHNRKASTIYECSTTTGSWDLISNMPTLSITAWLLSCWPMR